MGEGERITERVSTVARSVTYPPTNSLLEHPVLNDASCSKLALVPHPLAPSTSVAHVRGPVPDTHREGEGGARAEDVGMGFDELPRPVIQRTRQGGDCRRRRGRGWFFPSKRGERDGDGRRALNVERVDCEVY